MNSSEMDIPIAHAVGSVAKVRFLSANELNLLQLKSQEQEWLLGEIHFGQWLRPVSKLSHPHILVGMRQLGPMPLIEVWTSSLPVSYGHSRAISFSQNSEIIFGCLQLAQAGYFEAQAEEAYGAILHFLAGQGYPHLLRMWNYFPEITKKTDDLDQYQRFCRSRFQALENYYGDFYPNLPAASAVGTQNGDFVIYFIAAKTPGIAQENPRQMAAYYYPKQYGPRSPAFARATLKHWGQESHLYLSGTASIVGHESRHPGDPQAQLAETLRNVRTLLKIANETSGLSFSELNPLTHLKVYVRHPSDYGFIREQLNRTFPSTVSKLYLQGDICRTDLLLEIEGLFSVTSSLSPKQVP